MNGGLQIAELLAAYRSGAVTPVDIAETVLARVEASPDPAVWIARVPADELRARAAALMAMPDGARTLPLYGVPFAVKDNIDVADLATTAGCPAFAYVPASNATVVERLLGAGAMLVGKTNLDQFATGLVGTRSPYGAPRSVFEPRFVSGGSSSGSAVAVAAGLVSFALGTDTAGSGRVPAAFNNIVGVKPTRGLLPCSGVVPACRSLDCVSIFAASAAAADLVRSVVQGPDPADPFSRAMAPVPLPAEGFRFGVLASAEREFFGDASAAALYDQAIARLESLGGEAVLFDYAPFRAVADLLYQGPWVAERLHAVREFHAQHRDEIDPVVATILDGADGHSAVDAFDGQYRLAALKQRADAEWRKFDVMLLPTTPTIYRVDEVRADPVGVNSRLGYYTNFVNLLDYAAVAVPVGFRGDGLPLGVTLIGSAFSDSGLAALAERLHVAMDAGAGRDREPVAALERPQIDPGLVQVAVAGAHLSGMALNPQLTALGAVLVRSIKTTPDYRLFALSNTTPAKPGLVRTPGFEGSGIAVEVWAMTAQAFGQFVAMIPAPMGIGKVRLANGEEVPGFLCEAYALRDALDITEFGGWRAYVASLS